MPRAFYFRQYFSLARPTTEPVEKTTSRAQLELKIVSTVHVHTYMTHCFAVNSALKCNTSLMKYGLSLWMNELHGKMFPHPTTFSPVKAYVPPYLFTNSPDGLALTANLYSTVKLLGSFSFSWFPKKSPKQWLALSWPVSQWTARKKPWPAR